MRTGKSSAVADVAAQAGPDQGRSVAHTLDAGDQGDLLGFDQEMELFAGHAVAPPKRGPGRPPGSVNRTTLQLQRLLMARGHRDPAEFLSSIVSMDARELAKQLSHPEKIGDLVVEVTSVGAAVELQIKAARELLPYFHQKMPIAVQHSGDGQRPLIIINDGPQAVARAPGRGEAMSVHDAQDIEQDQGLSEAEPARSHGGHSHE